MNNHEDTITTIGVLICFIIGCIFLGYEYGYKVGCGLFFILIGLKESNLEIKIENKFGRTDQ